MVIIIFLIIFIILIYLINYKEKFTNDNNYLFFKDFNTQYYIFINNNGEVEFSQNKYTAFIAPIGLSNYQLQILNPYNNNNKTIFNVVYDINTSNIITIPTTVIIPKNIKLLFWNGQNILYKNNNQLFYLVVKNNKSYFFTNEQYKYHL